MTGPYEDYEVTPENYNPYLDGDDLENLMDQESWEDARAEQDYYDNEQE